MRRTVPPWQQRGRVASCQAVAPQQPANLRAAHLGRSGCTAARSGCTAARSGCTAARSGCTLRAPGNRSAAPGQRVLRPDAARARPWPARLWRVRLAGRMACAGDGSLARNCSGHMSAPAQAPLCRKLAAMAHPGWQGCAPGRWASTLRAGHARRVSACPAARRGLCSTPQGPRALRNKFATKTQRALLDAQHTRQRVSAAHLLWARAPGTRAEAAATRHAAHLSGRQAGKQPVLEQRDTAGGATRAPAWPHAAPRTAARLGASVGACLDLSASTPGSSDCRLGWWGCTLRRTQAGASERTQALLRGSAPRTRAGHIEHAWQGRDGAERNRSSSPQGDARVLCTGRAPAWARRRVAWAGGAVRCDTRASPSQWNRCVNNLIHGRRRATYVGQRARA